MRIYIASPYSPLSDNKHHCLQESAHNVDRAISVAIKVLDKGHIPFVPHLTHYIHTHHECHKEYGWYAIDNTFLRHWAEAILYLAPSKGADGELALAKELGLKIFQSIDEIPNERTT